MSNYESVFKIFLDDENPLCLERYCCFHEYVYFCTDFQTQFLMELCSSQITRDTVEDLGPAVVQASQQALSGLRQHDLTGPIVNSILTGIQQICEGNQLDCVAKAWLIQNKVSASNFTGV